MTRTRAVPAAETTRRGRMTGGAAYLTAQQRAACGKIARRKVPRESHAEYEPSPQRPDPLDIIERQSATRVAELVPIRYGRMMESPFRFYRGAAAIMASDLAATPRSGIVAQLCGDAHLLNFRLLASPERHLMFDINDFDETLPGPWEWDIKRLVASLVIAGRQNGFTAAERSTVVTGTVQAYREWMRRFAGMRNLDVWYAQADADRIGAEFADQLSTTGRRRVSRALAKARTRDSLQAFEKLIVLVDGERRIAADPPLVMPIDDLLPDVQRAELEQQLHGLIHQYRDSLESDRRALLEQFHRSTWPARSSSCSAGTTRTRSCSRPRRPRCRCSPNTSARANTPTRDSAWSRGSG